MSNPDDVIVSSSSSIPTAISEVELNLEKREIADYVLKLVVGVEEADFTSFPNTSKFDNFVWTKFRRVLLKLKILKLPPGIVHIEDHAFSDCELLQVI